MNHAFKNGKFSSPSAGDNFWTPDHVPHPKGSPVAQLVVIKRHVDPALAHLVFVIASKALANT